MPAVQGPLIAGHLALPFPGKGNRVVMVSQHRALLSRDEADRPPRGSSWRQLSLALPLPFGSAPGTAVRTLTSDSSLVSGTHSAAAAAPSWLSSQNPLPQTLQVISRSSGLPLRNIPETVLSCTVTPGLPRTVKWLLPGLPTP